MEVGRLHLPQLERAGHFRLKDRTRICRIWGRPYPGFQPGFVLYPLLVEGNRPELGDLLYTLLTDGPKLKIST